MVALLRDTIGVVQAVHLLAVAGELGGLGADVDGYVGRALQLVDQHCIGPQSVAELDQYDLRHQPGQ